MSDKINQYLTFSVNNAEYGVDIMLVREIKGWTGVTRLPNTPEYLCGVMNLRGIIVPIFDLKCRFTGQSATVTTNSVIIILALENRNIGILVDAVSDILDIPGSEVKPPPETDVQVGAKFISGLISLEKRMVVLLDIQQLFDTKDLQTLSQHAA